MIKDANHSHQQSQQLLSWPLLHTLSLLPYSEKHQWINLVKATCQGQQIARAWVTQAK